MAGPEAGAGDAALACCFVRVFNGVHATGVWRGWQSAPAGAGFLRESTLAHAATMSIVVRFNPKNVTRAMYDESVRRLEEAGAWPNPDGL